MAAPRPSPADIQRLADGPHSSRLRAEWLLENADDDEGADFPPRLPDDDDLPPSGWEDEEYGPDDEPDDRDDEPEFVGDGFEEQW